MSGPDPVLLDALKGLIDRARAAAPDRPPLIGVAGSQACGKSTLCRAAARAWNCAWFSLDDVYRTRAERAELARAVHPLFAVRGAPGTHDLELALAVIDRLRTVGPEGRTPIPAFDKLADDRRPDADWPVFEGRPLAVLVDGWCLGATAQGEGDLAVPVNALEAEEDRDGVWRRAANAALAGDYARFFGEFDALLFLKAPGFEGVLDWRCEQEAGLLGIRPAELPPERRAALVRFVAHYERLTRHMLEGGVAADAVADLRPDRSVAAMV